MGTGSSKLPNISTPDGYDERKEILDDPFYEPHCQFFAARNKDGTFVDPNIPPRVMAKVYQCPDGYTQMNRISILLDQRKQMNGENCLKLLNHFNTYNRHMHVAVWEYPSYTLDAEIKSRSSEATKYNFVALTQVLAI